MVTTKHSRENWDKYSTLIGQEYMLELARKLRAGLRMKKSVAAVVSIPSIENPYRDDWKQNDRLVGVIRDGVVVTVMLSRQEQINKSHLRVSIVIE